MINLTDEPLKYNIGSTTIKIPPNGEIEINLNQIEHVKKPVMKRALKLLPKLHPKHLEVIKLKQPDKKIFRTRDEKTKLEEEEEQEEDKEYRLVKIRKGRPVKEEN